MKDAVVKVNSYMHDEAGITTEEASLVNQMTKKRLRKGEGLAEEMQGYPAVAVSGNPEATTAVLCWGSTKGVCNEIAQELGLRVIRPIVLLPFPAVEDKKGIDRYKKSDCSRRECNGATRTSCRTARDYRTSPDPAV